jgi:hypothetical protein
MEEKGRNEGGANEGDLSTYEGEEKGMEESGWVFESGMATK